MFLFVPSPDFSLKLLNVANQAVCVVSPSFLYCSMGCRALRPIPDSDAPWTFRNVNSELSGSLSAVAFQVCATVLGGRVIWIVGGRFYLEADLSIPSSGHRDLITIVGMISPH